MLKLEIYKVNFLNIHHIVSIYDPLILIKNIPNIVLGHLVFSLLLDPEKYRSPVKYGDRNNRPVQICPVQYRPTVHLDESHFNKIQLVQKIIPTERVELIRTL